MSASDLARSTNVHFEPSLGIGFFKIPGAGLTAIGFGGFLYFQRDWNSN
jgi:hypothetical protein